MYYLVNSANTKRRGTETEKECSQLKQKTLGFRILLIVSQRPNDQNRSYFYYFSVEIEHRHL